VAKRSVIDSKWHTRKQCHSPCSIYGIALFVLYLTFVFVFRLLRPTHSEFHTSGVNNQVVCECECAWFLHGRLQITPHEAPPFRGLHLWVWWTELVGCTLTSSDPTSWQGISVAGGGVIWRQQGRYVKTKLQKTACFIVVESLDVPPEHTHTYILSAALIVPKDSRGTRSQNSKSGQCCLTSGSKLTG